MLFIIGVEAVIKSWNTHTPKIALCIDAFFIVAPPSKTPATAEKGIIRGA